MTQSQYKIYVKQLKTDKGITYKHISQQLNISYNYLNMWLNNQRNFSANLIDTLNKYLTIEGMI